MEQGPIVQEKSRAKAWFLPQRPYRVSTGQEATGGDKTQTGKRTARARRSCKGFCVGVLTQSSLLQGSKVIQEFTGLHSLGLGPQSCKPCKWPIRSPARSPQTPLAQGLGAGGWAYRRAQGCRWAGAPGMKGGVSVDGFENHQHWMCTCSYNK